MCGRLPVPHPSVKPSIRPGRTWLASANWPALLREYHRWDEGVRKERLPLIASGIRDRPHLTRAADKWNSHAEWELVKLALMPRESRFTGEATKPDLHG